jgi:hypothetical protein
MKRKIANLLMRLARKFDEEIIFDLFPAPSITILTHLECETNMKYAFGYDAGDDQKCVNGLARILGFDPYKGLHSMLEDGDVKEGAKTATIRVEGDDVYLDGKKVREKPVEEEVPI